MKLTQILQLYLPWHTNIIQMSPVRSGSTLVYNILREALPNVRIIKYHTYECYFSHLKVVATVRNPLDCIASIHKANKWKPSLDSVELGAARFLANGGDAITALRDRPNALILRYEEFFQDFDVIFDAFESFFNIQLNTTIRNELRRKYSVENVEKITTTQNSFKSWDKETLFHGNHISETKGSPGVASDFFSAEQMERLEELCQGYMNAFDYTLCA